MIAISYKSQGVGKFLSNSKVQHTWTFKINSKTHKVDFLESKMSGNFEIVLDDQARLYKGNHQGTEKAFLFDFDVNNVNLQIKSVDGVFDIFYKNHSFHFYLKNPEFNRHSVSAQVDARPIPMGASFENELRNGILQHNPIPIQKKVDLSRRGTVEARSVERKRALSEFGLAIPVQKLPLLDPRVVVGKTREVVIHGRCQLESRGDFFLEIEFPDGNDNAFNIYQVVHHNT